MVSSIEEVRAMGLDSSTASFVVPTYNRSGCYQSGKSCVLLREPERCLECAKVYISLYPLKSCRDHEGLDEI